MKKGCFTIYIYACNFDHALNNSCMSHQVYGNLPVNFQMVQNICMHHCDK